MLHFAPGGAPRRASLTDPGPAPRGPHLRRLACLAAATVVLGLVAAPSSGAARGAAGPGTAPTVDEISSSRNLTQVANLPKQAPFDGPNSYNTDWAFQGRYAFGGNYNGFTVYDIARPTAPPIVAQVLCPGSQNDVSVSGRAAVPVHRLAAHQRLVRQRRVHRDGAGRTLGGHQDLRHQRPADARAT